MSVKPEEHNQGGAGSPYRGKPSLTDDKRYGGKAGRDTNSNDADSLRRRVFVGNLAAEKTSKAEVEDIFSKFGEIESCSLHNNFGFIQFARNEDADKAVLEMHGQHLFGKRIDVNLAGMRRKTQTKDKYDAPPPKEQVVPEYMREFGAKKPPRARSRSPVRGGGRPPGDFGRSLSPMSRYEELYRKDDSYTRPHDPYDPPGYNQSRDPHSERREEYNPPRYERDYLPPKEEPYHRGYDGYDRPPAPRIVRPAIDCEIVALSKDESRYADEVESRLRSIGVVSNIGFPPPELPVPEIIERIGRAGTLYVIVVSAQNALHRSCTLNILHGTRQEHRNMPLEQAVSFVARNFDFYLKALRNPYSGATPTPVPYNGPRNDSRAYNPAPTGYRPPPPIDSRPLATNVEKKMTNEELTEMLEKLKREKEEREAEAAMTRSIGPISAGGYYDTQYR